MYNSIADVFNSPKATYNDPLYEIHNTVKSCKEPHMKDYDEFLNNLDYSVYPNPQNKIYHCTINPLHGALKPVCNK